MRRPALAISFAFALAACSRDTAVPAKRPLTLTPSTAAVAPRERLTFTAGGGASGYRFAFSGTPASGSDATLDASTGAYRAGSTGPGTDVIAVTDQAGATATATVAVGAMLTISPQLALVAPGGTATFTADGGLPPYTFSFTRKGNRSGGRIDGVSGEYAAGPNAGTQDRVEVTDAAGAVARPTSPIYVGALHLPLPGGATELELADLNGDGREDVVALEPLASNPRRLTTTMLLPGGAAVSETYFTTDGSLSGLDLTGDRRADLFAGSFGGSAANLYQPDASGHLVLDGSYALAFVPRLPYVLGYTGFTGCPLSGGTGVYRFAWPSGALASIDPPTCVTSVSPADASHFGDLAYGHFESDNASTTVAWLERDVYSGPIYGTGTAQLHFATATPRVVGVPGGGLSAVLPTGGARQQLVAGNLRGAAGLATDAAVLLAHPSTRNLLYVLPSFTTGAGPAWSTGLDPFGGSPPALGVARCPPLPGTTQDTLVTWNGTLKAEVLAVDGAGAPSVSSAHVTSVYVPITVGACGDVNGDGVPDLAVASDSTSTMAVLWGDGDGGFGRRPHFQSTPVFTMAQVDCDGVGDVVVATDAPSLVTYLGDEHQLARVAETPVTIAPAGIWAGNLGGSSLPGWAGDLVVADTSSNLYVAPGSTSGLFGRLAALRDAPAASGRIPRIVRVAFAELGGTAAGLDVVVLYELKPAGSAGTTPVPGSYELDVIVRQATGTPRVISYAFTGSSLPDVQPVDLDGDGVDELVVPDTVIAGAGSVKQWRPLRLRVDLAAGAISLLGNPNPTYAWATHLPLSAAGRRGDVAVFTSVGEAELVSGAGVDPVTVVTALPDGLSAPYPVAAGNVMAPGRAALGVVSPVTDLPVLAFSDGRGVRILPGVLAGGKLAGFTSGTIGKAPGVFAGLAPQGVLSAADVLVFTGEELIPLVWTGSALR